jgi:hypothetical protein
MKVARREDRFRRHLPDRDRVRELLVGQPAESFDEVAPQEGQELVPIPVEDRADLEEGEEQFEQTDRCARIDHRKRIGREGSHGREGERLGATSPNMEYQHGECRTREQQKFVDASERGGKPTEPARSGSFAGRRISRAPDRLVDDGEENRLHPLEEPDRCRYSPPTDVESGEGENDRGGREDEEYPTDEETQPTGSSIAAKDDHLGRVRTRDEVGDSEKVEELLLAEPVPPNEDLFAQHRDMGSWPPEGEAAAFERHERDVSEMATLLAVSFRETAAHRRSLAHARLPTIDRCWRQGARIRQKSDTGLLPS